MFIYQIPSLSFERSMYIVRYTDMSTGWPPFRNRFSTTTLQSGTVFQNGSTVEPFWLHFFSQCSQAEITHTIVMSLMGGIHGIWNMQYWQYFPNCVTKAVRKLWFCLVNLLVYVSATLSLMERSIYV